MNFEAARKAMIETQIRPNDVRDPAILQAFSAVPRELFVPGHLSPLAYSDDALEIVPRTQGGGARTLLAPMVLAKLLEHAALKVKSRVLDVGGLTGYSAAILTAMGMVVTALETGEETAAVMKDYLHNGGVTGPIIVHGPLAEGWPTGQPYGVILINGAVSHEPRRLFEQLGEGGRLVAIRGSVRHGHAMVFTKTASSISARVIFDAAAQVLPGFELPQAFAF